MIAHASAALSADVRLAFPAATYVGLVLQMVAASAELVAIDVRMVAASIQKLNPVLKAIERLQRSQRCATRGCLVSVAVLALDRPDIRLIFFEWIDVHHPVEDYRMEGSAGGIASFLRGDRSF
jgi:hypothetical protein